MKKLLILAVLLLVPSIASAYPCSSYVGSTFANACVEHPDQSMDDQVTIGAAAPYLVAMPGDWFFGPSIGYDTGNDVGVFEFQFTWAGSALDLSGRNSS